MIYLSSPSTETVRAAMRAGELGAMLNPGDRRAPGHLEGIAFAIDNGCFADNWNAEKWLAHLDRYREIAGCLFAVVPDVVADAAATRAHWDRWRSEVTDRGYQPAYVSQDGLDLDEVPWGEVKAWFTGGSDAWKLSEEAHAAAAAARARGIWTHLGRVNSLRRLELARNLGYDSADGTFLAFAPDGNLDRVRVWLDSLHARPHLPLG